MTTESVAAALVTRNAGSWIEPLLISILEQSRPPDAIVVVDDHSTDGTVEQIRSALGDDVTILPAASTASRSIDRIAQNFTQAVGACAAHDVVILGDHDDVWLPRRIEHQVRQLHQDSSSPRLMVASDGRLVDDLGQPINGTLRSRFRLPNDRRNDPHAVLRLTLTHLVATGGASALRPGAFPTLEVPPGWLHDRWWSLIAAARGGLVLDDATVIDYRVHQAQQAGLRQGGHGLTWSSRALAVGPLVALRKMIDFRFTLRSQATSDLRHELSLPSLSQTFLFRVLPH